MSFHRHRIALSLGVLLLISGLAPGAEAQEGCARTITAKVYAIDQPFFLNRLGAMMPEGMVFALARDVVPVDPSTCPSGQYCPKFRLRDGKRPRPLVLRANVGDCLSIEFTNHLSELVAPVPGICLKTETIDGKLVCTERVQPATRQASIHVAGMQMVSTIADDGSYVGVNASSLAAPGQSRTYVLRATAQGTFLLNSEGAAWGGLNLPNDGAQVTAGLFGAVNVEPSGAVWLRSQITHAEMMAAIDKTKGNNGFTPAGQPLLDFSSPVLQMLSPTNEIIYSDLTAVIAGPKENGYMFPNTDDPNTSPVPYVPDRTEPFREFTVEYHELNDSQQAFPVFNYQKAALTRTLQAAGDAFAINYGSGGIGAEILANRFGLGPMNSCADCRFEEFFLSSWTVGDPAMVVDYPANAPCTNTSLNNPSVTNTAEAAANCRPGVKGNAPKKDPHNKDPLKAEERIVPQRKATRTLYPDDPSNVYHSYINDRVIFRTLHAGTGVSHVHHLHAHQWFHTPNSKGSTYLDSQLINPGSAYTMEIAHLGSGNLNKVVGDSIFHCHFYPHFAAGMWAHWRSHDVFEIGTQLDQYGTPISGWNRVQPDGEIEAGTPIPALVPMPTKPMAPMPARVQIVTVADPNDPTGPPVGWRAETHPDDLKAGINPGFPFFIPGVGGTRAPHPPMDFAVETRKNSKGQTVKKELDGGLPRHLVLNGVITEEEHNYLNFSKDMDHVNAYQLPEQGTDVEKVAMAYHAKCTHDTFTSLGAPAKYRTNGLPPVSGAPFADPAVGTESNSDVCKPVPGEYTYKAAAIQTDVVLNKVGWHYPQSRLLTLWEDAVPTINGARPPEPFFIRAAAESVVNYWHTNLVPAYYLLDDYQVRTPTDIIGQHIHLVKFDVTSSDGAANGFNYEDGTLSYEEVQALIEGINECGGLAAGPNSIKRCTEGKPTRKTLKAEAPPSLLCPDPTRKPCSEWFGAQTTVQRWLADSLVSDEYPRNAGERTLRTVFTHDHFGPSTHQQTGLYAAFLVEPTKSKFFLNDAAKTPMNSRKDGGPTSWEAIIETPSSTPPGRNNIYREFALALQDFQFAYLPNSISEEQMKARGEVFGLETQQDGTTEVVVSGGKLSWSDPSNAISPSAIQTLQTVSPVLPAPQIVSAGPTPGTLSFNYRNEPLPFRVQGAGSFTGGTNATDLSYVFASNITRNLPAMNTQPALGAPIGTSGFKFPMKALTPGMEPGDPFTPLLRAYENDLVQIRVIVGAHMLPHDFNIQGIKWLFEPSFGNSGYRSNQSMGISEHFEFLFTVPRASPSTDTRRNWSDYLYMTDASNQAHGIVDGMWGLFRAYKSKRDDLPTLSTNTSIAPLPAKTGGYSCPPGAPVRAYTVQAESPTSPIIYNGRGVDGSGKFPSTTIQNPFPMLYTVQDMTPPGGTKTNFTPNSDEPLILRANAGECVAVTLKNAMNTAAPVFDITSTAPFALNVPLAPSTSAGLTPALMSFDVMNSGGLNVGFNPVQTVAPNASTTYYWYAGETEIDAAGYVKGLPIEFGGVNLTPSDPLEQDKHGLIGGLIVEPPGSVACFDTNNANVTNSVTYASANIYEGTNCTNPGKLRHREFVLLTQDDVSNLRWGAACYCAATGMKKAGDDCTPCLTPVQTALASPEESPAIQTAINYRVEPMSYRFNATAFVDLDTVWRGFSDGWVMEEPQTPIFSAARNTPTRMHLLHPGGSGDQQVLALHGHVWQELPYINESSVIGDNKLSMWLGARDNYGTNTSYSIILDGNGGAGGRNGVIGDYIYRTTPANFVSQGIWGLFRVGAAGSDIVSVAAAQFSSGGLQVAGSSSVFVDNKANAKNGQRAKTVSLSWRPKGSTGAGTLINGSVNVLEGGLWSFNTGPTGSIPDPGNSEIVATSPLGGQAVAPISLALLPSTPADEQRSNTLGESIRFVNTPRPTSAAGEPVPTEAKPNEGLLAPITPGVPPAPKSGEPEGASTPPPSNQ
jgi:manganese oxidase